MRPLRRAAIAVALGWLVYLHLQIFPEVANHAYIQILVLALCCGLDASKEEDQALFLQALRWLTVIVMFWAGCQKLWYGTWFDGRILFYLVGLDPDAQTAGQLLLPAAELERLASYGDAPVQGPFLGDSLLVVALSNLAWMSEIAVAGLLLVPRTRAIGVPVGIAMMVGIEFIARELVFGLLMVSMICLFAERDWNRKLLPGYLVIMAIMVGVRLEWLPEILWQ